MYEEFIRTEAMLGKGAMCKLRDAHVAVFGLGGVGSYALEALARSGVGALTLVDGDIAAMSNINRQLIATHASVGLLKTDVAKDRILSINPHCKVSAHAVYYSSETADSLDFSPLSYIADAIDSVSSKIELVCRAQAANVPIISSMGAGNKLDPTRFSVADIYDTSVCPLARVIRRELKKRGVAGLKVVYSTETPISVEGPAPGSVAFVPSVAGLIMAGEIVKDIIKTDAF